MTDAPEYAAGDADLRLVILTWYRRARRAQLAHARAASAARRLHLFLGVPSVALGAAVGSAIFASINSTPAKFVQLGAGLLSLTAAGLAALQTFLRLDERTREHEVAARSFGALRRRLGELGAICGRNRADVLSQIEEVRKLYDATSEATPNVPPGIWEAVSHSEQYWPSEFSWWPEAPSANGT